MGALLYFITSFLIFHASLAADVYRTVDTNSGQVRGVRKTSFLKNVDFYSFKGIPYGKSPTGELRFKAPVPIDPWKPKILDAFDFGNTCVRPNTISNDDYPQSEDCLFLNIFVPADAKADNKLAVMFWIFGGGFFDGTGNDDIYGPDFLMEQNVILVTINYRVGVFGFLSLGTPEYSGNMALKDQQLALKWIHENIGPFHGDNHRITVFGDSAGGISTHFQVLSSESRKYIKNAIVMSGTAHSIWSLSEVNDHTPFAYQIAAESGEPKGSVEELIEFFKTIPAEKIKYTAMHESTYYRTFNVKFSPVIERKDAKNAFLIESPEEIYKKSDIDTDIIFYHTSLEAIHYFFYVYPFMRYTVWDLNSNFTLKLPFKDFKFPFESNEYRELTKEVRQFYFGDAVIDESTTLQYLHLISDINFVYPTSKSIKIHRKESKGKTFYVRFSVDSRLNFLKILVPLEIYHAEERASHIPEASHYDAECYMFRCNLYQSYYDKVLKDGDSKPAKVCLQTIENITKLFSNFAKYGEPTYKYDLIAGFQPIQSDDLNFLDITNDGFSLSEDPRKKANEFWAQLEEKVLQITKSQKPNGN